MKPVLILENSTNSLITEFKKNQKGERVYEMSGIFTEFDVLNRNERIYTAPKFLPALNEMKQRMDELGVVYGEFDHPDVFDTSLSRASHVVSKADYIQEKNHVYGEIQLLSTYWGREAKSLVDDQRPLFVSSRAAGITESDGSVSLKKLFTYDLVADPGFGSAKMSVKSLNESLGYKNPKSNFRIFEMSDESKINDIFEMNKSDFVTKKQISDYSNYLINEISSVKKTIKNASIEGRMEPKKLDTIMSYYEELMETNNRFVKYMDYLAEHVQVLVNENKNLKLTQEKLIKHNDYLAENLEKNINYSEYIAEQLDKNISYSEYLAENLDKNIGYAEYLAENLDKNISYSEYLAENLDKNIAYSEYIAENLDKNIAYSEYIAENLDKNISYSEYLAENLDNNIAYSEYLAEHLDDNIAYSEYIAENLDDNIAYSEYIAEGLDKSITYQGRIVEKLNSKVNESYGDDKFPSLEDAGFDDDEDDTEELYFNDEKLADDFENEEEDWGDDNVIVENKEEDLEDDLELENECDTDDFDGESDSELSKSIDKLISEAKKRKAAENNDVHFLKFLNKSQVDSFYDLTNEEQENVKLYISEKSYFTTKEVLSLISEALSTKGETLEQRIVRLMPDSVKPIWNQLNESSKKSLLSQARLFPEEVLMTETQVENFWNTRNLKKNESVTKKLVEHNSLIQEDNISDKELGSILERFKSL